MSNEKELNKEQLQAVRHKTGPLLVIAGAGTGKTTVITERIKYLIEKGLTRPEEILALTFTEKASREMEARVDVALPYGYTNMWIMTFHSFCERILRQHGLHIGLDPRFKLMTETETVQLIRKNIFLFKLNYFRPLGNPNKFIGGMIQHFSRLQDEDVSPADYLDWARKKQKRKDITEEQKSESEKWLELSNAFRTHEELKVKSGFMDFGDLIAKTLKLLRDRPNILKEYQKQFKYILIDEFQDTNYAQNKLALLMVGKEKNITVVGDDDQSVYRFRGAAVSNIIQFRKSFPKAKVVVLTRNYRSTQEILDRSYDLIQHNNPDRLEVVEKIDKRLVALASTRKPAKVRFIHTDRVENEAEEVAKEIKKLSSRYDYKDFAILVRANNHAEPFSRSLSRNGIPYQFLGPGRLFKQPEIIDLISYLKVLYNFEDSVSMYRILTMPEFEVDARDVAKIGNYAKKYNLSLFEVCEKVNEILVSGETKTKVGKILQIIIKHLGLIRKESAGQILYYFLEESGLLRNLIDPKSKDVEKRAGNISKFFDKLKSYETDHEDANVFAIVDWIDLSQELGESPMATDNDWGEINAVNILTVHSSKGLEFPIVFLINLVGERFPTRERHEQIPIPNELIKEVLPQGDYHMEEERRLFYVGMTRAKERLYLTAANYYGEGKREKKLSPFISEALGGALATEKQIIQKGGKVFLGYSNDEIRTGEDSHKLKINYLSYSQIETFKICPLHYKLKYILRIPTPTSASQSFGISIHSTLQKFYEGVRDGDKPNEKYIFKVLEDNWVKEGFTSKKHEDKFYGQAKEFLSEFLEEQFNSDHLPVAMEIPFTIPLSNDLKIGGKIDRVDELADGRIEIWDYKTGANVPTQREVDHDMQLTFYALAATTLQEKPFGKKAEEVLLTLYYFDGKKKITTTRTKEDLEKVKKEILKFRDEINKSSFKCSDNMLCKNCEYKLLCSVEE